MFVLRNTQKMCVVAHYVLFGCSSTFLSLTTFVNGIILLRHVTNRAIVENFWWLLVCVVYCPVQSVGAFEGSVFIYYRFCDVSVSTRCRLHICDVRAFNADEKCSWNMSLYFLPTL